jgi:hypothetical protein
MNKKYIDRMFTVHWFNDRYWQMDDGLLDSVMFGPLGLPAVDVDVRVKEEQLDDVDVSLLSCQVQRGPPVLALDVHLPAAEQNFCQIGHFIIHHVGKAQGMYSPKGQCSSIARGTGRRPTRDKVMTIMGVYVKDTAIHLRKKGTYLSNMLLHNRVQALLKWVIRHV